MEKPKVVLKKVKFFQGHEGYGLNAEVYINGVYCMFVIDDGNGGCMDFQYNLRMGKDEHNAKIKANIKLLEDYIATLPEKTAEFEGMSKFTYKQTMETYINDLVEEQDRAKKKAKFEKKMIGLFAQAIVFGVPDSGKYQYMTLHKPIEFYNNDLYRNVIQTYVNQVVRTHCKNGVQILNTNLKPMGITY